jgi:hypothetical protein
MKKHSIKSAFSALELTATIAIISIIVVAIVGSQKLISSAKISSARKEAIKSPVKNFDGLQIWYESSLLASFAGSYPSNNQTISSWSDIRFTDPTRQDNATSTSEQSSPTFDKKGINGLPALSFDGIDDNLSFNYDFSSYNNYTIFLVHAPSEELSVLASGSGPITPGAGDCNETTYTYTGSAETCIVPGGASDIDVMVKGAGGGNAQAGGRGAVGGMTSGTITVTGGDVLYIYVGRGGVQYGTRGRGAGTGGGGSAILLNGATKNEALLVAGGGGGGGGTDGYRAGNHGGAGGGLNGLNGTGGDGPGRGATSSGPGSGIGGGRRNGSTATSNNINGGHGATSSNYCGEGVTAGVFGWGNGGGVARCGGDGSGAGGGGGWYGGGSGGGREGGGSGGGGSGYINSIVTNPVYTTSGGSAAQTHGQVTLSNFLVQSAEPEIFEAKQPKIWTIENNDKLYSNGSLVIDDIFTQDVISQNPTTGELNSNFSSSYKGKISEFIVYNRKLSSEERGEIEQYLAKKYNIELN